MYEFSDEIVFRTLKGRTVFEFLVSVRIIQRLRLVAIQDILNRTCADQSADSEITRPGGGTACTIRLRLGAARRQRRSQLAIVVDHTLGNSGQLQFFVQTIRLASMECMVGICTLLALSLITEICGQDLYGVNKISIGEIHRIFPELCLINH